MQKLPIESIDSVIHVIRGQKVIIDADLARIYGVETKRLNEAVRRNSERFPEHFLFRLTTTEADEWRSRSQFATLKRGHNVKYSLTPGLVRVGRPKSRWQVATDDGLVARSTIFRQ
ncbi:MAG: ORF6N domain-containing protein, partial [Verrucomicrobia bacterium]|nr:ORF6N domain-containing protein [Verrucomicrobiota bacterium]